jgi:hypothetical protein
MCSTEMPKFIEQVGKNKCDAMFEALKNQALREKKK